MQSASPPPSKTGAEPENKELLHMSPDSLFVFNPKDFEVLLLSLCERDTGGNQGSFGTSPCTWTGRVHGPDACRLSIPRIPVPKRRLLRSLREGAVPFCFELVGGRLKLPRVGHCSRHVQKLGFPSQCPEKGALFQTCAVFQGRRLMWGLTVDRQAQRKVDDLEFSTKLSSLSKLAFA